jgi:hypothetical protein
MPIRPPLGDQHLPERSRHAKASPREQPLLPLASRSSAPEHFCLARRAGVSASARRTNALDDNQASVLGLAALLLVGDRTSGDRPPNLDAGGATGRAPESIGRS